MLAWAAQQSLPVAVPLFVFGITILGGRHLALAILMHEASHGTLFKTKWLNDTFADWVCAKPIWNDVQKYKVHHFAHHSKTGQQGDTDLSLVAGLPCTRASLWRKFARDLSGYTGLESFFSAALSWMPASSSGQCPTTSGNCHRKDGAGTTTCVTWSATAGVPRLCTPCCLAWHGPAAMHGSMASSCSLTSRHFR